MPAAQRVTFDTPLALSVGEHVDVAVPDHYLLLGTIFVHGLPLVAQLIGALVGAGLGGSDASAALGSLAGLGVALAAAPRFRRELERQTLRRVRLAADSAPSGARAACGCPCRL